MKESDVVKHLKKVVAEMRGTTRKVKWEGRKHAPDLLVLLPLTSCWVETKAPGVEARDGQLREHARLRASGMKVFVLDSVEAVDLWAEYRWVRTTMLTGPMRGIHAALHAGERREHG